MKRNKSGNESVSIDKLVMTLLGETIVLIIVAYNRKLNF